MRDNPLWPDEILSRKIFFLFYIFYCNLYFNSLLSFQRFELE